jgi:hypothetical protein
MGFLRKVGRKIKKRVKKLFSSKLGSLIGSIGLSMIMGPVISKAFNGIKGVFTGAAQKGTEAAIQEGTKELVKEGTKELVKQGTEDVVKKGIVDNTVTGAMEKVVADNTLTNNFLLQTQEGLKGQVLEPSKFTVKDIVVSKPSPLPKPTLGQQLGNKVTDFGTGVKEFASDPFGKTKEYLGEEFIPDAVQSMAMSGIESALAPEYEAPFQSKGVQQVGSDIQSSYMREVQTQVPNLQATNFQQLNQSLLYGTLSPQYLANQTG